MKAHEIHHTYGQAHVIMEPGDATRYELSLTALPAEVGRELGGAFLFRMAIGDGIEACAALTGGATSAWVLEHFGKGLGGCAAYNAKAYSWFYDNVGPIMKGLAMRDRSGRVPLEWEGGLKAKFRREVRGIDDENT